MRVLERFVEKPRPCSYLPERQASLDVRVMLDVGETEMDGLLERGWRRFGPIYFRPACSGCAECVSLRVDVARFAPTKSQRRAMRACAGLRRVVSRPTVDDARLALHAKWHASRERVRGWDANPQTRDRYALEFGFPHPCAREVAFYDDAAGALVGVGLHDTTPRAVSAAFFFYDPAYARLSLGTANVVSLIEDARATGQTHVYLGFRVSGCASLAYKAAFGPHELLYDRPSSLVDPPPQWQGVPSPG
jgi:arginine-tRNA-protein transferase